MLYTNIQLHSFIGSGEVFYHIKTWRPCCSMAHDNLKILAITFHYKTSCEIWWKLLKRSEKKTLKSLHNFIRIYSPGARADNLQVPKFWLWLKCLTTFITHCKLQSVVFNTFWENDFSTFSSYKCIGAQIWPCRKKAKDQPRVVIWINLVDLDFDQICS